MFTSADLGGRHDPALWRSASGQLRAKASYSVPPSADLRVSALRGNRFVCVSSNIQRVEMVEPLACFVGVYPNASSSRNSSGGGILQPCCGRMPQSQACGPGACMPMENARKRGITFPSDVGPSPHSLFRRPAHLASLRRMSSIALLHQDGARPRWSFRQCRFPGRTETTQCV